MLCIRYVVIYYISYQFDNFTSVGIRIMLNLILIFKPIYKTSFTCILLSLEKITTNHLNNVWTFVFQILNYIFSLISKTICFFILLIFFKKNIMFLIKLCESNKIYDYV